MDLIERFRGALVGLAVGDALGGPLDGLSLHEIELRHGAIRDFVPGGWLELELGEYTDNTSQALSVLESFIRLSRLDIEDVARRLLDRYESNIKGLDATSAKVLKLVKDGIHPMDAAEEVWSEGDPTRTKANGALLRASPIGLLRFNDTNSMILESSLVTGITHHDPRCKAASVILNYLLGAILREEIDPIGETLEFASTFNTLLYYPLTEVSKTSPDDLKSTGFIVELLQIGLYFFQHCHSFDEGVALAVGLGDDTATAGALTGLLLGAKFGIEGIEPKMRRRLKDSKRIDDLACSLYFIATEYV